MTFSIITVCYNCKDSIVSTIRSVLAQFCDDYEYLIIDGASNDGTTEIVKKYKLKYKQIRLISEPDKGIYDAMNKGVLNSKGEYIFFINSGDTFYNRKVLENVKKRIISDADIYFGAVNLIGKGIKTYPRKLSKFRLVYREKMICHQVIFAKKQALLRWPFDLKYRICADRDWLIKCVCNHLKIENVQPIVVANYDPNGVSSKHTAFVSDSLKLAKKYGGFMAVIYIKFVRGLVYIAGKRYTD